MTNVCLGERGQARRHGVRSTGGYGRQRPLTQGKSCLLAVRQGTGTFLGKQTIARTKSNDLRCSR
jgi:hypothetical protein